MGAYGQYAFGVLHKLLHKTVAQTGQFVLEKAMKARYLYKRGNRYYFRKRIPNDLKAFFGVDCFHRALLTIDIWEANQRGAYLYSEYQKVCLILRTSMISTTEKLSVVLKFQNLYFDIYRNGFIIPSQEGFSANAEESMYKFNIKGHSMEDVGVLNIGNVFTERIWGFYDIEWLAVSDKDKQNFYNSLFSESVYQFSSELIVSSLFNKFINLCLKATDTSFDFEGIVSVAEEISPNFFNSGNGLKAVKSFMEEFYTDGRLNKYNFKISEIQAKGLYAFFGFIIQPEIKKISEELIRILWITYFTEKTTLKIIDAFNSSETMPLNEIFHFAPKKGYGKVIKSELLEYFNFNFKNAYEVLKKSVSKTLDFENCILEDVSQALARFLCSSPETSISFLTRNVSEETHVLKEFEENKKQIISSQIEVHPSMFAKTVRLFNEFMAKLCENHVKETGEIASYSVGTQKFVSDVSTDKKSKSISLKKFIRKFRNDNIAKKKWSPKLQKELHSMMKLLEEFLEGIDFQKMSYDDALQKVFNPLQKLPAFRSTKKKYKGKSVKELLSMRGDCNRQFLSVPTVNKYMYWYTALFEFGVKRKYLKENPFIELKIADDRNPEDEKDPFSTEDLSRLFNSPLYNHRDFQKEFKRIHRSGKNRFWLPILGLYTGMRLSEICSLRTSDFVIDMDINCIRVNKKQKGKSVKSKAGYRLVPMHPVLKKLGLLSFVEELTRKKQNRLFPKLPESKIMGSGHKFTSFFRTIVLKFLILYFNEGDKKSFHSFRHNFSTALKYSGADMMMIDEITGHTGGLRTESKRYSKFYTTTHKYEALSKLKYEIDIYKILKEQNALPECAGKEDHNSENIAIAVPKKK